MHVDREMYMFTSSCCVLFINELLIIKQQGFVYVFRENSKMNGELHLEPLDNQNPSDSHANAPSSLSELLKTGIDEDITECSVPCCRICLDCDGDKGELLASHFY